MNKAENAAPLSLPVHVARLPQAGMPVRFKTTPAERAAVAERLGILAVDALEADLLVRRWKRDGIAVEGRITGALAQACVVTLEPVHAVVDEPVDLVFVPETSKLARIQPEGDGELHLDPEGADIPETFRGDTIDLGPLLEELVGLSLDPYPRAPGVEFSELDTDPDPSGGKVSPFAALGRLKASGG
ncbi:DUF177 domain-containing protein [Aureimonas flava]|uniref:DUF177 domain-containing protein n=1 Tax=Aureimonas flava TaxID=2320271 RepID=A0A3A1WR83_9HYPH|nr:DUF177 domain-containing protein [Aureimonas flava]RIY03573.1 DUF177 domain-containing protein [Aureimonas flava]